MNNKDIADAFDRGYIYPKNIGEPIGIARMKECQDIHNMEKLKEKAFNTLNDSSYDNATLTLTKKSLELTINDNNNTHTYKEKIFGNSVIEKTCIDSNNNVTKTELITKVKELYRDDYTQDQIGKYINISQSHVSNIINGN
ncbi:hypothetical protein BFL38_10640 [Brachyspira hampsonii]|uniref:Uncharacterized protein n=1 Tax=Brachyspira hampsonii TaxID=1287055 RepID=A0A1E5NIG2_9SPIR|nr:hypothetical protein [Brachyspira hampsonii]OEJ15906.1 hypothetical protein BFL38_10640 [Brachyspira hampsonii]